MNRKTCCGAGTVVDVVVVLVELVVTTMGRVVDVGEGTVVEVLETGMVVVLLLGCGNEVVELEEVAVDGFVVVVVELF